jgi:uncharacterized phage-associated protein
MAKVKDVAAYIQKFLPAPANALKLQKLAYYAQAWSLAWDDQPLFIEPIEAWRSGPCCPILRTQEQRGFRGDPRRLTEREKATIDSVLEYYGEFTSTQLVALTHREAPWREARSGLAPADRSNRLIALESMKRYYAPMAEPGVKRVPDPVRAGVSVLLQVPQDEIDGLNRIANVDSDAVLSWLRTGEGDPWREN